MSTMGKTKINPAPGSSGHLPHADRVRSRAERRQRRLDAERRATRSPSRDPKCENAGSSTTGAPDPVPAPAPERGRSVEAAKRISDKRKALRE